MEVSCKFIEPFLVTSKYPINFIINIIVVISNILFDIVAVILVAAAQSYTSLSYIISQRMSQDQQE